MILKTVPGRKPSHQSLRRRRKTPCFLDVSFSLYVLNRFDIHYVQTLQETSSQSDEEVAKYALTDKMPGGNKKNLTDFQVKKKLCCSTSLMESSLPISLMMLADLVCWFGNCNSGWLRISIV